MELSLEFSQEGQTPNKSNLYVKSRCLLDKRGFLNIKIPKDQLDDLEDVKFVVVRHHVNYFFKIFGLPFESVRERRLREQ